jgi:hypothetical protein
MFDQKLSILLIVFALPVLLGTHAVVRVPVEHAFVIEGDSELFIRGASNVNKFTCMCFCIEEGRTRTLRMEAAAGGRSVIFQQTRLQLETSALDCGHKGMNNDLYNTLKADAHPLISIELLRASEMGQSLSAGNGAVPIKARAAITIAGVRREVDIDVQGRQSSAGEYRFSGSRELLMTDFNIQPPRAMMGLIKVNNEISIHLDLAIRLLNA